MSTIAVSTDQRPDGWSDGSAAYDEWFAPVSSRFAVLPRGLEALLTHSPSVGDFPAAW